MWSCLPELEKLLVFTPTSVATRGNARTYSVRVSHAIILYCGCDTSGLMAPELVGVDGTIRAIRIDIPDTTIKLVG